MIRLAAGGILAVLTAAMAPPAEGAGWKDHYDAGLKAMKGGDNDEAAERMKQAVAAAEALGPERPEVARALAGLSDVYLAQQRTTEAGLLLERSLFILAKTPGANADDLTHVYHSLSRVRVSQERFAEAESLLNRVIAVREKTPGADFSDVADTLDQLSGAYLLKKQGRDSASAEKRALELRVRSAGSSPSKRIKALLEQADFESWHDGADKAEALRKQVLEIQEKTLGADHPDVADTLMKLATARISVSSKGSFSLSVDIGDLTTAMMMDVKKLNTKAAEIFRPNEPLVTRALAIREKALGADDPETIKAVDYLVAGYVVIGDDARAEPLLKRSLTANENALGPDHLDLVDRLVHLSDIATRRRSYREAIPLLKRLVVLQKKAREEKKSGGDDRFPLLSPPLSLSTLGDGDDDEKDDPGDFADQLARAVRMADLMDDPASQPTKADLAFLKSLGCVPATTTVVGLTEVTKVQVECTRLDDAGLAHFRGLVNLRSFRILPGTGGLIKKSVTDAGLVHLRKLTGLKRLSLKGAGITGTGLDSLKGMTGLKHLDLNLTPLDDAGLAHLPALPGLEQLLLTRTKITDASAPVLKRLNGLTYLSLLGTNVSEAGVNELREASPGLHVLAPPASGRPPRPEPCQ